MTQLVQPRIRVTPGELDVEPGKPFVLQVTVKNTTAIIDAFEQPADDRRARPTRCRVLDGRYDVTRGVVAGRLLGAAATEGARAEAGAAAARLRGPHSSWCGPSCPNGRMQP